QRDRQRRRDRGERGRVSGPADDEDEDQPDVIRLPYRAHGVMGVLPNRPTTLTRAPSELPEPGAEVGPAEHRIGREPEEHQDERDVSEPHLLPPRPARAERDSGAARSTRRRARAPRTPARASRNPRESRSLR